MRSSRHHKLLKNECTQSRRKRRCKPRSTFRNLGCAKNISNLDFQSINEVLRIHKAQRAEGKGSWKIVPKDSCEVYKNRRRRQEETSRNDEYDDQTMASTESECDSNGGKKKRSERKLTKTSTRKSRRRRRKSDNCRCSKHSSSPSTTSTYSSYFSSTEMENDSN